MASMASGGQGGTQFGTFALPATVAAPLTQAMSVEAVNTGDSSGAMSVEAVNTSAVIRPETGSLSVSLSPIPDQGSGEEQSAIRQDDDAEQPQTVLF